MAGRINHEVVAALYKLGYSQGDIAAIYDSVSGHISKVLKAKGVPVRVRGVKATRVSFEKMPKPFQDVLRAEGLDSRVKRVNAESKVNDRKNGSVTVWKTNKEIPKKYTNEQLDKIAINLLKNLVKHTHLNKVRFKESPAWVYDVFNKGYRTFGLAAGYNETKDVFLWINEDNVNQYYDMCTKEGVKLSSGASAMDYYYGDYSVIDSDICPAMKQVLEYMDRLEERVRNKYPLLDINIRIEASEDLLYVSVGCRNKE